MQIKVHGTTVIASFKQEVERSDQHMRDLISHLNGEGASDALSTDEVKANATEMSISATGEIKSGLGEDGNQTDLPEGAQELYALASAPAVSIDDGEESKSNVPSERGPVDKNVTDSKIDARPVTNDSNVPTQNVTDAGAAQNSTLANVSAKDLEDSQGPKNVSEVSNGTDINLGSRAEEGEGVLSETPSRDAQNATLPVDITVPLPASNDSALSSLPASTNSVAVPVAISSNVEKNGSEPVPGISAGASAGAVAAGGSSGKTAESNATLPISKDSSVESNSVEIVKENATTTIPKSESTPKSVLPTVSSTAAIDNTALAKKPSSNLDTVAAANGDAKAESFESTKSTVAVTDTTADTANGTVTATVTGAGESEKSNITAASANATAGRNEAEATDDSANNVLIANMTEKIEVEVNATVPAADALADPSVNTSTASPAPKEKGNNTCSSLAECSKESSLPLNGTTATNTTVTSDLNSTVSTAEISTPAISALGPAVDADADTDADVLSQGDVVQKNSTHSDASGGASEGTTADLLDGLRTAASIKYETILSTEDKEREWDKDDKISPLEAASLSGYGTLALGSVGSAAGALSPLAAGPLSAALLDTPVLPLLTPPGLRSINGPTVGFSPLCLETLRFTEFQAMMANKLKQRADSDKTQLPLHSQDNVFRQLMMKIKTLEMNYAIIEMYSAQVCHFLRLYLRYPPS
jgi:mucin-19